MLKFSSAQQQQTDSSIKKFAKDAIIVPEGARTEEMYVLLKGSAAVYKNHGKFNQQEVAALRIGGFYGENCLFLHQEAAETLVATAEATVLAINEKNYAEAFSRQPDVAYSIIGGLARKADSAQKAAERASGVSVPKVIDTGIVKSELFPPNHISYDLPLVNEKTEFVYKNTFSCPICGATFESLTVLTSRLRRESTDRDLRVRYAGIEPMHYDIVSCPTCLYSAPVDLFPTAPSRLRESVRGELANFISQNLIKPGMERDSVTVFAGYYLALKCVPICFDEYQTTMGALWQKLSRIYKDCGNEELYIYASDNAAKNYEYVYEHFHISEAQSQQVCFILGDLFERRKNYDKARNFFFLAKANRQGTPALKMLSDRRLEDLKELMKK